MSCGPYRKYLDEWSRHSKKEGNHAGMSIVFKSYKEGSWESDNSPLNTEKVDRTMSHLVLCCI